MGTCLIPERSHGGVHAQRPGLAFECDTDRPAVKVALTYLCACVFLLLTRSFAN